MTQAGNTGTVDGGTENDSIFAAGNSGAMLLFLGAGADTVNFTGSSGAQTIVGGTNSSDGADFIVGFSGDDLMFGNGGNDILNVSGRRQPTDSNTAIGGFGNDSIVRNTTGGTDLAFGNEGNDTIYLSGGNDTDIGGQGNDCLYYITGSGNPLFFGNEGNDTIIATSATAATIVGGQNSADGADSILSGTGADLIFGNGGNDTIDAGSGANTVVGGFGNDSIITAGTGGRSRLRQRGQRHGGGRRRQQHRVRRPGQRFDPRRRRPRDAAGQRGQRHHPRRRRGGVSIDTIAGGTGNDVFAYSDGGGDGNNAVGGGPLEQITDLDWSVDKFQTGVAGHLRHQHRSRHRRRPQRRRPTTRSPRPSRSAAAARGQRGGAVHLRRPHLPVAMSLDAGTTTFTDATDLLIDITGATGAIATSNFV